MSIFLNLQLSASLKRQDHLITNFCNGGSIREQIFYNKKLLLDGLDKKIQATMWRT